LLFTWDACSGIECAIGRQSYRPSLFRHGVAALPLPADCKMHFADCTVD